MSGARWLNRLNVDAIRGVSMYVFLKRKGNTRRKYELYVILVAILLHTRVNCLNSDCLSKDVGMNAMPASDANACCIVKFEFPTPLLR